ncbi:hypothetical protein [Vibrio phage vB_pir03]|nr:hypothetical protein [Vibrio phage vB_pir03]
MFTRELNLSEILNIPTETAVLVDRLVKSETLTWEQIFKSELLWAWGWKPVKDQPAMVRTKIDYGTNKLYVITARSHTLCLVTKDIDTDTLQGKIREKLPLGNVMPSLEKVLAEHQELVMEHSIRAAQEVFELEEYTRERLYVDYDNTGMHPKKEIGDWVESSAFGAHAITARQYYENGEYKIENSPEVLISNVIADNPAASRTEYQLHVPHLPRVETTVSNFNERRIVVAKSDHGHPKLKGVSVVTEYNNLGLVLDVKREDANLTRFYYTEGKEKLLAATYLETTTSFRDSLIFKYDYQFNDDGTLYSITIRNRTMQYTKDWSLNEKENVVAKFYF